MKVKYKWTAPLVMSVILLICQYQFSPAGETRDDDYYRQRDELIAQEKDLLTEENNTANQVFDLKREINALYKQLAAAQNRQGTIRYKLISIHMKLMD